MVECTVVYKNFTETTKELRKNLRVYNYLNSILIKYPPCSVSGFRIKNIELKGTISPLIECNIKTFFSNLNFNFQSSEVETSYFERNSISFSVEKDHLNPNTLSFPPLRLNDPIEQLRKTLIEKKKKFLNCTEPCIIAIMQWGSSLWFEEGTLKRIEELQIDTISTKISGLLILPPNSKFFPFCDSKFINENNLNKEILVYLSFKDEVNRMYRTGCKEKRYFYFIRNPSALYPLSMDFEIKLSNIIKVIELPAC